MNALIISNDTNISLIFENACAAEGLTIVKRETAGASIEEVVKRETDLCVIDWSYIEALNSELADILISTARTMIPYLIMILPNDNAIAAALKIGLDDFIVASQLHEECVGRIRLAKKRIAEKNQSTTEKSMNCIDQTVLDAMQTGLMALNSQGTVTMVNAVVLKALGLEMKDIIGVNYHRIPVKMQMEDGTEVCRANDPFHSSLINGNMIRNLNLKIHSPTRAPLWISLSSAPLFRKGESEPYSLMITLNDITDHKEMERKIERQYKRIERSNALLNEQKNQLKEANARLEELVDTDGLTGVKNYRAFKERLAHEYDRAMRYGGGLSLVMIDVDRFKRFNDSYGHPAGDVVLKKVAMMLQDSLRSTDMVARYGGEEFVILLPNTDRIGAVTMADRFRKELQNADWEHSPITASFGVSTLTPATPENEVIVDEADKALYFAKQSGRNCVKHYWEMTEESPIAAWNAYSYDE